MGRDLREAFYNLRNQFDKQKVVADNVGTAACSPYVALIPDITEKVVLDAGLGTGWLTRLLATRNPAFIYGVDISSDRVAEAAAEFAGSAIAHEFRAGSIEDLSFIADQQVDFINCRDVIEHLPDPDACLKEFRRILKPGGRLLIETGNDLFHGTLKINHFFYDLLQFALTGERRVADDGPFLEGDGRQLVGSQEEFLAEIKSEGLKEHEHQWAPLEFATLLEGHGFKVESLSGTPILSSSFFQLGAQSPGITDFYVRFVQSPEFPAFLESMCNDLHCVGRIGGDLLEFPAAYVLSDDLIVLAEKPGNERRSSAGE